MTNEEIKEEEKQKSEELKNKLDQKKEDRGKKETRGRKKKVDVESELKEAKEEIYKLAQKPVQTLLSTVNKLFFNVLPDELKNAGCNEISEKEIDALTESLVPCLDKWGWLEFETKPEYVLLFTSFVIFYPRFKIANDFLKEKRKEKVDSLYIEPKNVIYEDEEEKEKEKEKENKKDKK